MKYGRFLFSLILVAAIVQGTFARADEGRYFVGMANAYRYNLNSAQSNYKTDISVPIEFPLDFKGALINWSQKTMAYLPKKFLISDGTVFRTFTMVDRTSGSIVDQYVQKIRALMAKQAGKSHPSLLSKSEVLEYVTYRIQDHLSWHSKDGKGFAWDQGLNSPQSLSKKLDHQRSQLLTRPNGQWIETQEKHPAISFSRILESKKGFCLEMAMLASFILESFEIPHKIVFGSVLTNDSQGAGHCWLELADGRILDVAWNTIAKPQKNQHPLQKDWLWFGNDIGFQYRYAYQFFPIIQL